MSLKKFDSVNYSSYYPSVGRIRHHVLISRSGAIFFDRKFTFSCVYRNPVVFIKCYALSIASFFRRAVIKMEDGPQKYGIIHSIWTAGYYHWITESLPRALALKDLSPDYVPILPSVRYASYVDSLKLLGLNRVEFYPEDSNVIINSPLLTDCPSSFAITDPTLLNRLSDLICNQVCTDKIENPTRVVYVSRRKARGRKIINEESLVKLLSTFGVEVICFEDYSFAEQVKLMGDTKCLISIHGAALTNMLFMPPGGTVIEILPEKNGVFDYNYVRNSFRHDSCYIRLAAVRDHQHIPVFGRAKVPFYSGTHMADIELNDQSLARIASLIISK